MNLTPTDIAWMVPLGSLAVIAFVTGLLLQNRAFAMEAKRNAEAAARAAATAEPESRSRSAE